MALLFTLIGQPLVGGCSFYVLNIAYLSFDCKSLFGVCMSGIIPTVTFHGVGKLRHHKQGLF